MSSVSHTASDDRRRPSAPDIGLRPSASRPSRLLPCELPRLGGTEPALLPDPALPPEPSHPESRPGSPAASKTADRSRAAEPRRGRASPALGGDRCAGAGESGPGVGKRAGEGELEACA
eukprot:scaffold19677_cov62-Isochrysis_galbana.AAC.1